MRPQRPVQSVAKAARHEMLGDIAMRDLRQRMHPGMGPPPARDADRLAADRLDRIFQRALHRGPIVLQLPAAERTAVIFDGEFVTGHLFATIYLSSWPGLTRPSILFGRTLVKIDGYAGQARV